MAYFVVSYDLNEGEDDRIVEILNRIGAARALHSAWFIEINGTADELIRHLKKLVDESALLMVFELKQKPIYSRMFTTGANWLAARFN